MSGAGPPQAAPTSQRCGATQVSVGKWAASWRALRQASHHLEPAKKAQNQRLKQNKQGFPSLALIEMHYIVVSVQVSDLYIWLGIHRKLIRDQRSTILTSGWLVRKLRVLSIRKRRRGR